MAQHLSIRVPWKDNGYSGLVCDKPCYNNACLRLKNISDSRDDDFEETLKGCPIAGHERKIPCVSEGGVFMSAVAHTRINIHPYKESNPETHGHFRETELIYPPYSLPSRPFAWTMLRKGNDRDDHNIRRLADRHNIDYDPAREPELSFTTNWIQDAVNQRSVFKTFYENVTPNHSLVIPYAKQVPFIDDTKRVVMGIGFVKSVTAPPEHNHTDDGKLRSILWETMIGHSIRNDRNDGFLLPYREMMEYAEAHPDFDIRSITVFAEDDYFEEFSYATEQVSHDAVISVLLQTLKALDIIKDCIPGNWQDCIDWTTARLNEVWLDRGAFPGLGSMLCAVGFKFGVVLASDIKNIISEGEDYEGFVAKTIKNPTAYFRSEIAASIGKTEQGAFLSLTGERKALFWLLARLSLRVWIPIISLRREDASRFGYDNAPAWKALLSSKAIEIADSLKIHPDHLKWYAAFHNESHHPHVHMICYSTGHTEGYLNRQGIRKMKSSLAQEIFRQELIPLYGEKTVRREDLKEQAAVIMRELIRQMKSGVLVSDRMEQLILHLAEQLQNTSGKKQYGYLKAALKNVVDEIVDELGKDSRVAEAYRLWWETRSGIESIYTETPSEPPPLSRCDDFKSIRNMVIQEALLIGSMTFEEPSSVDMALPEDTIADDIPSLDITSEGKAAETHPGGWLLSRWQFSAHAGLRPTSARGRHPVGQQEVYEHEAFRGACRRRFLCQLTSSCQRLHTNLRIILDTTVNCIAFSFFIYNFVEILIIYNIRVELGGIICYYKGNLMLILN